MGRGLTHIVRASRMEAQRPASFATRGALGFSYFRGLQPAADGAGAPSGGYGGEAPIVKKPPSSPISHRG